MRELEAGAEQRIDLALAGERTRIATEVDATVALLLNGVRPLAERARHAAADEFASLMTAVHDRAQAAMLELRRAVRLLRTPEPAHDATTPPVQDAPPLDPPGFARSEPVPGDGLGVAMAASRRTRVVHALELVAPVVLLALLGLADRLTVTVDPFPSPFPVPDPVLGAVSPWVTAIALRVAAARCATAGRSRRALAVFALILARMLLHDLSTLTFSQFYVTAAVTFIGAAHARRPQAGAVVVAAGTLTSLAVHGARAATVRGVRVQLRRRCCRSRAGSAGCSCATAWRPPLAPAAPTSAPTAPRRSAPASASWPSG